MKFFDWNGNKNDFLRRVRGVTFEEVVLAIESGDLLDRVKHLNLDKYPAQYIFYVKIEDYVYAVPYVEDVEKIYYKTIIPDRKATRRYLGGKTDEKK